ncbi:MAG: CHRD domain-containing protein [Acidobacteriota bacterium]|nr:MAG: CHRD domain-containing protein [Acidobacteriota bacterium]
MKFKGVFLGLVLAVLVSASSAFAANDIFQVPLDAEQMVPGPGNASSSGMCLGDFDSASSELTMICSHSVEAATAAHIHSGGVGEAGPPIFTFPGAASPLVATFVLSSQDVDELFEQRFYVQVHSEARPGGELRGQIGLPADQGVSFPLTSDQVPMSGSAYRQGAEGACMGVLAPAENQYMLGCRHNVMDATAAHIHMAPAGQTGPVWFTLSAGTSFLASVTPGNFVGSDDFGDFLRAMDSDNLYVNVHSPDQPGGKIRGQIPVPPRAYYFPQFGNGDGFTSAIVLMNTSTTTAVSGMVYMQDPEGQPLTVGIEEEGASALSGLLGTPGSEASFSLSAYGRTTIQTDGEGSVNDQVGSVKVIANGPMAGIIKFDVPDQFAGSGVVGVSLSPAMTRATAPAYLKGAVRTGLAIRNPETFPVDVTLQLRDADGNPLDSLVGTGGPLPGSVVVTIPANGRIAAFIPELFGIELSDFDGTIVMQTERGSFAALALEQGTRAGEFTTKPVAPLVGP